MDRRYQVFVSSTFLDLVQERQAVLRGILGTNHMPAGMELFPASDESAWSLITRVIDESDYYVLIIGGRYGSEDAEGVGYTEREYDYAYAQKKPVIALLHQDPAKLPRNRTETGDAWEKLKAFRSKVESRHTCAMWTSAEDLESRVILSLTSTFNRTPAVGWVRADQVASEASVSEILRLRNRISELETLAEESRTSPPPGTEGLAQGIDTYEFGIFFNAGKPPEASFQYARYSGKFKIDWNTIFASIAPSMITEATEASIRKTIGDLFATTARQGLRSDKSWKDYLFRDFTSTDTDLENVIVQLRSLGLIHEGTQKRSVHDRQKYWSLTPYGDHLMTQLRAIRRPSAIEAPPPETRKTRTARGRGA